MDIKKCLPIVLLLLAGCTTTARMNRHDIGAIQIDCTKKQQQLNFLRSQWPSGTEQMINGLMISSSLGFVSTVADGTYQDRRDWNDGGLTSALRLKIYQIESLCANYPPY
jgi:hypothetical protein